MRRVMLFALAGSLALSACGTDDTSTAPSEAVPEAKVVACRPAPFPISNLTKQTIKIFPVTGGLQAKALVSEVAIGVLWTLCKPTDAQKGVAAFVNWTVQQFQAGKLIGGTTQPSSQRVATLINTLYAAIGLPSPAIPPGAIGSGGDVGVGVFTGPELLVKTVNDSAGALIPANSFPVPSVITIYRRPDSPSPFPPGVVAPFYDINVSNAANTHTLNGTQTALVGFCVDDEVLGSFSSPAIAHLTAPAVFEVLPRADTDPLDLACDPFEIGASGFGLFRSFASIFLPEELHAAVGTTKSGLGGLARSLSPFGVTEGATYHLEFYHQDDSPFGGDVPSGEGNFTFDLGQHPTIQWCENCFESNSVTKYPSVIVKDAQGTPIGGVQVHVELQQLDGDGVFDTEESDVTLSTEPENSENIPEGTALFGSLNIDSESGNTGTYRLVFTLPDISGAAPLNSRAFDAGYTE